MDRVVLITAKFSLDTQRAQGELSPHAKLPARHVHPTRKFSSCARAKAGADKSAYDATAKKLATPVQQEFRDLRRRRDRRDEGRGACGLSEDLLFELHKTQPLA